MGGWEKVQEGEGREEERSGGFFFLLGEFFLFLPCSENEAERKNLGPPVCEREQERKRRERQREQTPERREQRESWRCPRRKPENCRDLHR